VKWAPALSALAACGLAACGPSVPPVPRVLSIDPSTMTSSSVANVTISVDAVLPFTVNYGTRDVTVNDLAFIRVGDVSVGSSHCDADGRLQARVPSKLQTGAHNVTVTLAGDNREGVLENAFNVTAGAWPMNGFAIAPIDPVQHVDVAFLLTITAQGNGAGAFNGTVDYTISNVSTRPVTTGPFTNGVYQESLVIHSNSMGPIHITAVDLLGRIATSNDFTVIP